MGGENGLQIWNQRKKLHIGLYRNTQERNSSGVPDQNAYALYAIVCTYTMHTVLVWNTSAAIIWNIFYASLYAIYCTDSESAIRFFIARTFFNMMSLTLSGHRFIYI